MDYKSIEKRLLAAHTVFDSETFDVSTFGSLKTLLWGIHPRVDTCLTSAEKVATHIDMLNKGDVIPLTAHAIPVHTEKEKKRKKYILLFLKYWNDLKSEVARVEKELSNAQASGGTTNTTWGKIFSVTKGPFAVITLIAVGVVWLRMTEVSVVIKNTNCQPIEPVTQFAVSVPGLSLPKDTIVAGSEGIAKLPPLDVTVNATSSQLITLSMYGLTYEFELRSGGIQVSFDGELLNGKSTNLALGKTRTHTVEIRCP